MFSKTILFFFFSEGYGHKVFESFHKLRPSTINKGETHLPLTLGRDFAGIIKAVGEGVKNLKPGDKVMGVIPPPSSGSHAQYLVTSSCNVHIKPDNLTMEEAASIPYAGLTAWSALSITAELCVSSKGKKVLVLGGAGGVGSLATQILKNWGTLVKLVLLKNY